MSNEVIHKNASLMKTGCGGCLVIIIIIILIGAYIYLTERADKKADSNGQAPVVEAINQDKATTQALAEKAEEKSPVPIEDSKATPKVNAIEVEAKTVKPVEEKTIIAPKTDNFF